MPAKGAGWERVRDRGQLREGIVVVDLSRGARACRKVRRNGEIMTDQLHNLFIGGLQCPTNTPAKMIESHKE